MVYRRKAGKKSAKGRKAPIRTRKTSDDDFIENDYNPNSSEYGRIAGVVTN